MNRSDGQDGPGDLSISTYETIPPNPKGSVRALARIGYRIEEALADLVDNSIDATAKTVLIRFVYSGAMVRRVVIADDGLGMSLQQLREAMKVGADTGKKPGNLGKYGIGLKTASFSQCQHMTVITRSDGHCNGRSWARHEAESGWRCGVVNSDAVTQALDSDWSTLNLHRHGTLVFWDHLERLQPRRASPEQYLQSIVRLVALHLGMVFHRFLERNDIRLLLEIRREGRKSPDLETSVKSINPFAYPASGDAHYPREFLLDLGTGTKIRSVAHIWPRKSTAVEYKLGSGKVARRQGFYFYRNDRLIQAGGWNGVINQDDEPHLSLARVEVSLPAVLDDAFGLTVQKSGVEVPTGFVEAVERSRAGDLTFEGYRKDAKTAYGRSAPKAIQDLPVVLGAGIHPDIRNRVIRAFGGSTGRLNKVKIRWTSELEDGTFFAINIHQRKILLNLRYRRAFGGTAADEGGLLKSALFLLVKDEFQKRKTSAKLDQWLADCNRVLMAGWTSRP